MTSVSIRGVTVHEWDEVCLTGACSSWGGRRLEDIRGTVGTVARDGSAIKVWPEQELDDGKLWFPVADIERIEVLWREEASNLADLAE